MVKETEYYDRLSVTSRASKRELIKAYRRLAIVHHPDKQPADKEAFKLIVQAYNILSEPRTRKIYDEEGEDGIKRLSSTDESGDEDGDDSPPNNFTQWEFHVEEFVKLRVVDRSGAEIEYRIKKTASIVKLMRAYAKRVCKEYDLLSFLYNGCPLDEADTPARLGMKENDMVEAQQRKRAGRRRR